MSANRRTNSCPVERRIPDSCEDRPKSVLGTHNKDDCKNEDTLSLDVTAKPSENKAKVNPWLESKSKDKEKTNVSGGSKLFRHFPQPTTPPESSGMTRPQTEPGRMRTQMFSDSARNLPRSSVHGVAKSTADTGNERDEPEGGWVMVDKSPSETVMSCDPDDETNVIVLSPNKEIEETKEKSEKENSERTKKLLSNKFGSTFKVLPETRDKTTSAGTGRESSRPSGGLNKLMSAVEAADRPGKASIGNIITFAATITKWKQSRGANVGFGSLDPEHRELLATESTHLKTEIPEAMMRTIKEEAFRIVLKTTQAYRSQIGSKHKLTKEAFEYLKDLREELKRQ
ncbi:uncharacterized protein LOC114542138 [Dendronephthya gigantea]|uniref:uncharacterized protein LOC114542138 n=1 Tax=Dendronephthya gigantea TaxID=151771 RepID=UPI001068D684|nr:uncharacterized protein LOC114542138 [Dendronephthya gigantea]